MEDITIISQELVKALFEYNPDTGIFIRKLTTGSKAKAGSVAGILNDVGYLELSINSYRYRAHRIAWLYCFGEFPSGQLDHIDGNKSNNALDNLREATNKENAYNKSISVLNTTGYKGVSLDKRSGRYRAYITVNGKQKGLGYYSTAEQASEAYIIEAKKLHGEFFNENTSIS
jgi:hypothetical protein